MLEGRDWHKMSGASADELAGLRAMVPFDLPIRYFDLLAFSNGGEGPLAVQPYNFVLDPASTVAEMIDHVNDDRPDLAGFFIFGGDGGGEYIAFDTRDAACPIVAIDMIAGAHSAMRIADDFDAFVNLIGRPAERP